MSGAIAWAIRGRVTGRVREVTLDEDVAREAAEHYDVFELVEGKPLEVES